MNPLQNHIYSIRHRFLRSDDTKCDKCKGGNFIYICPECHNELPARMMEEGAEIISVIGGPNSGKSHYIVALLHELRENGFEIGLTPTLLQVGENQRFHTSKLYNDAIEKLNKNKEWLDKTPEDRPSLPWIIRIDSTDPQIRGRQKPKKSIYLVFYDTAGEHFNNKDQMTQNANYLRQSKAVIVLLDTLSIPAIMEMLKDEYPEGNHTPFDTTWDALGNYITEAQEGEKDNQHLFQKPFAFVLSKFDVVLDHADDLGFQIQEFRDGRGRPIDKSYINGQREFDLTQVEKANEAIRNALESRNQWNHPNFSNWVWDQWEDDARFFGISAVGKTTVDEITKKPLVDQSGIHPYRVMDPLLWIMYKLGGFGFKTFNS